MIPALKKPRFVASCPRCLYFASGERSETVSDALREHDEKVHLSVERQKERG